MYVNFYQLYNDNGTIDHVYYVRFGKIRCVCTVLSIYLKLTTVGNSSEIAKNNTQNMYVCYCQYIKYVKMKHYF